MPRSIREFMTTRVVSVRPDAPVSRAVDLMRRFGFSAIPVADQAYRLVGMVSLLDVVRFREQEPGAADPDVDSIMNPDVVSMPPTASPDVVAHRMRTYGELRVIPIVQRGVLVGVVTRGDLLRPRRRVGLLGRFRRRREDPDAALARLVRPVRPGPPAPDDTPVADVMTRDVAAVGRNVTVPAAVEAMVRGRYRAMPVVEADGRLVGVFSEADALGDRLYEQARGRTVGGVMSTPPVSLPATATVGEARRLVAEQGLRLVPIVDGETLAGVVTRRDLV